MSTPQASAYDRLRTQILKGSLPPGEWLREENLANDLGVSRTPVREALRRLHADGLVEVTPRRGAQVVTVSDADMADTYELRSRLEGLAARRAAMKGYDDLAALRRLCDEMEALLDRLDDDACERMTLLNLRLHEIVTAAAEVKALPALLSGIMQVSVVRHTFSHYTQAELDRSFAQHRELIDAIEARDPDWAEAVMRSHLLGARASLRDHIARRPGRTSDP
jgi:DNA-binding GntR family transcriptional regulator